MRVVKTHSKERLLDILRSIPLAKPSNIYERSQYLQIYPSNEEEYHKIRETLSNHDVKVRCSYIDSKADGLVIRDRIITNFVPDGYKPLKSITNPKHYELFNVPESVENSLLFLNGYHIYYIADGSNYVSRVHFMYKKDGIMKMSPNIIQIRHIEGLDRPFLDEIFDGIHFHKISAPLTPKGVWKLYVANRDDYFILLTKPYFIGDIFMTSINNISSNILIKPDNQNLPPVDNGNYSDQEKIGSVKGLMFHPKNLKTYMQMVKNGVNDNGHHFYPNEIQ
ncbi:hypothetical protein RF11_05017 [Thelohanellus kitauei]|uniref:Uncharacterized protein n=1 Tax=Thelohanellus kitauei TaxID=669202 RepID=A0A0C2IYD7_THEKT|nr:hypothetical protein RF11_05017 [Thelohanellus kitauei]